MSDLSHDNKFSNIQVIRVPKKKTETKIYIIFQIFQIYKPINLRISTNPK